MELLWQSLTKEPANIASPDWHAEILEARLAKVVRGEGTFLSLDEVKRRLGRG
jgi:hypothetical protein